MITVYFAFVTMALFAAMAVNIVASVSNARI